MATPNYITSGTRTGCAPSIGYQGSRQQKGLKFTNIVTQSLSTNSVHARVQSFQSKQQYKQNVVQNSGQQYDNISQSSQRNPKPVAVADSSSRAMIQRINASGKSSTGVGQTQMQTYGSKSGNNNAVNSALSRCRGGGTTPQKCAISKSNCIG